MSYVRSANRFGKPSEVADGGYAANGEGEHSRRSARGKEPKFRIGRVARDRSENRPLAEVIAWYEKRIKFLECELQIEDSPIRKAKIAHDITEKGRQLTKLMLQRDGE